MTASFEDLRRRVSGEIHLPATPGYTRATTPRNATARQAPGTVAKVSCGADVAACARWAAGSEVPGVVQATGHGAGRTVGEELLWAYRGRWGVGIATRLELRLFPASGLWAGYLLWPAQHAGTVIPAWGDALGRCRELSPDLAGAAGGVAGKPLLRQRFESFREGS